MVKARLLSTLKEEVLGAWIIASTITSPVRHYIIPSMPTYFSSGIMWRLKCIILQAITIVREEYKNAAFTATIKKHISH